VTPDSRNAATPPAAAAAAHPGTILARHAAGAAMGRARSAPIMPGIAMADTADTRRELRPLALNAYLDGKSRRADMLGEAVELAEPRLWSERDPVLFAAQDAEQPAHLGERLARRRLDRCEIVSLALLAVAEAPAHGLRLGSRSR
jgi:hypothetical protein